VAFVHGKRRTLDPAGGTYDLRTKAMEAANYERSYINLSLECSEVYAFGYDKQKLQGLAQF
jgi:hypothetical protein